MTRARFGSGTVAVTFRSGRAVELAPEDFWDLYSPRGCKIDPPGELDPDNVVTLRKDDIEVRVVASPQLQFWYAWQLGFWERETFNVIDKFVTKGHTFIDVGAWIGPTVLYGVHRAARAFAFEPDPVAFPELEANAKANGIEALELINTAVSATAGPVRLGNKRGRGGDSRSSTLVADGKRSWEVETTQLDEFARERCIDGDIFLKVDIEGGEYDLIPALRSWLAGRSVDLYLSMHPQLLDASIRKQRPGDGFFNRVARRVAFYWRNYQLLAGLPFKNLYNADGRRVTVRSLMRNAVPRGGFAIVATDRPWS